MWNELEAMRCDRGDSERDRGCRPHVSPALCADTSAVHDLAAFSEGNLSRTGKRRLAHHAARCRTCARALVALVVGLSPARGRSRP